jgi:glycosyltransferase involved in cell wall biosynthesis
MHSEHRFAMACFMRSGDDNFARVLENHGLLDFYALGTLRGAKGIPPEHTRLQPIFGLLNYMAAVTLPVFQAESLRFRTFGLFDRWAQSLLRPGQHFFTGTAFANGAMRRAKRDGGLAFLDSWTSHPEDHWNLVAEEQRRWGSRYPPGARCYQDRAVESVAVADYICTSSTFVRQSYLKRGFDPQRLLLCPYPVDLSLYQPAPEARPANRPLTILQTGGLSLRKGTPYLLEAFRLIRKEVPDAVLRVQRNIRNDVVHVLRRNADLPLEWSGYLDFASHVRRFQTSDLLLFPSVEDGFAQVVAEALACGLPVITTPNTGASDLIRPGENGEVVPICDAKALAGAALKWWDRIRAGERIDHLDELKQRLSFQQFEETFIGHLARIGIPSQHDAKPSTPVS